MARWLIILLLILSGSTANAQVIICNPEYEMRSTYVAKEARYYCDYIQPYNQYFILDTVAKTLMHSWNMPGDRNDLRAEDIRYDAALNAYICTLHCPSGVKSYVAYILLNRDRKSHSVRLEKMLKGRENKDALKISTFTGNLSTLSLDVSCDSYKYLSNLAYIKKDTLMQLLYKFQLAPLARRKSWIKVRPGYIDWMTTDTASQTTTIHLEMVSVKYVSTKNVTAVVWSCETKGGGYLARYFDVSYGTSPIITTKAGYGDSRAITITERILGAESDVLVLQ